jgi:hypothetical protein
MTTFENTDVKLTVLPFRYDNDPTSAPEKYYFEVVDKQTGIVYERRLKREVIVDANHMLSEKALGMAKFHECLRATDPIVKFISHAGTKVAQIRWPYKDRKKKRIIMIQIKEKYMTPRDVSELVRSNRQLVARVEVLEKQMTTLLDAISSNCAGNE